MLYVVFDVGEAAVLDCTRKRGTLSGTHMSQARRPLVDRSKGSDNSFGPVAPRSSIKTLCNCNLANDISNEITRRNWGRNVGKHTMARIN